MSENLVNEVQKRVQKIEGIICSFNVNIDVIHKLVEDELLNVLQRIYKNKMIDLTAPPPTTIRSPEDFIACLIYVIHNEKTAEWIIENPEVNDWIKTNFKEYHVRIGGQAGNIAYQLAKFGVRKVYLSIPSISTTQAKIYADFQNIYVPVRKDGKILLKHPLEAVNPEEEDLIHWVFEIPSGFTLKIEKLYHKTSAPLRFIATFDELCSKLFFKDDFEKAAMELAKKSNYALASGYHLLKKTYNDGSTPSEHVDKTIALIRSWKNANPNIKVHYEHGFMHDLDLIQIVFDRINGVIDAVGMNEVELPLILKAYGLKEAEKCWKLPNSTNLFEGLLKLYEIFGFGRLTLHTRDFAMSISSKRFDVEPVDELRGLIFGCLTAAALAATGKFCSIREIAEKVPKLENSTIGLKQKEVLSEYLKKYSHSEAKSFEQRSIFDGGDFILTYTPAKVVENPVVTVGLGDAFTAGLLVMEAS